MPKLDLALTLNRLASYNLGFTPLKFQPSVEDARTLETTTMIDKAIAASAQIMDYQGFSFGEPIFEDDPEESAGIGIVYGIQVAEKQNILASLSAHTLGLSKIKSAVSDPQLCLFF